MKIDPPTAGQLPALKALWKTAFGDTDDFIDGFFRTAFSPDRCRCAFIGGSLAGMLYWFDCECRGQKLAYIYAVATAPAFRRRGICHGLMADTHTWLADRGYAGALLVPGEPSLAALYGTMGYRYATGIRELTCAAGDPPVPLRPISPEEYCLLRRRYLPADGVVQEEENMRFLAAQAALYAAPGLLLAARAEGDALTGLELLGDPAAGPGILRALGAARGSFRTPGTAPFAMYRDFGGSPAPSYFGFAFD